MNKANINPIHVIEVVPIEIMGKAWLCIGFEEEGVDMGDAMHLAFLYKENYEPTRDLLRDATSMFMDNEHCPLVRIHSECLLGDALYSDLCDCGEQLRAALASVISNGSGVILYLRQEGRGIGMRAKLACLAAQEGYVQGVRSIKPMSPDEANLYHGYRIDERSYDVVPSMLQFLRIKEVTLMTGNIDKISAVNNGHIEVHSVTDIDRSHILSGTRKHRELIEKASRNYKYHI